MRIISYLMVKTTKLSFNLKIKIENFIHTYIHTYIHTSPNANYFWGKCESLRSTDSQYFWVTANQFKPIANHFANGFTKRPFLEKFYALRSNSANKLQIYC